LAKIKPFQAVIYNPGKVKDIAKVVCPPYDVVSPEDRQRYARTHPNNLIHILLSKEAAGQDKYKCAARYFTEWLKDEILIRDERPAIYFYSQQYLVKGEKKTRFGFITLLNLDDAHSSVFKHEHTRLEAKEDRLRLTREVKANLSPIFVVFKDKKRIIQRIQERFLNKEPFIDIVNSEGVAHKVWKIDSPQEIEIIRSGMSQEDIYIADGHHRFEVACAYQEEARTSRRNLTGEENFNYVLTYFTNTDPRGLVILPIHRLLKLGAGSVFEGFKDRLKEYFDLEEVRDKQRFFFLMQKAGLNEHLIGMYKGKKFWLLRLKNIRVLDELMADKPREYRLLDVAILNAIVFSKILHVDLQDKESLRYSPDAEEFISACDNDDSLVAFFMNPVKIEQIISVAEKKERMPPKSTYFYPKVLSGLVINKFE